MVRECRKQSSVWQIIYTKWHNLELIKSKQNTNTHTHAVQTSTLAAIFRSRAIARAYKLAIGARYNFGTARHATTDSLAAHEYDVFCLEQPICHICFVLPITQLPASCTLGSRFWWSTRSPSVILSERVWIYLCMCLSVCVCLLLHLRHSKHKSWHDMI